MALGSDEDSSRTWGRTGLFSKKKPMAKPYVLALRVTTRCLTECPHCCVQSTPNGTDMSLRLAEYLCRVAKANDIRVIHLTGGEPLLHPHLEEIVKAAHDEGLGVELVTSSYAPGVPDASQRLGRLRDVGLERMMVSFDDGHARRVSLEAMASFLTNALDLGLDTAVNTVEWPQAKWTRDEVRRHCNQLLVPTERVDWLRSELSATGRGKVSGVRERHRFSRARCAFSLTAPTVDPNGDVLVCCNVSYEFAAQRLGNVPDVPLELCLERLKRHPVCRINAAIGPWKAWLECGLSATTPLDTCAMCVSVMAAAARPTVMRKLESLSASLPELIPLDYKALNTWCQRAVPVDAPLAA